MYAQHFTFFQSNYDFQAGDTCTQSQELYWQDLGWILRPHALQAKSLTTKLHSELECSL